MYVKYYTLNDFRKEVFLPFGEEVEQGLREKMPYKQWRNLNSWSKHPDEYKMRVAREMVRRKEENGSFRDFPQWFVGPSSNHRTTPNPEGFDVDDNSFGEFLELIFLCDKIKFGPTSLVAFGKLGQTVEETSHALEKFTNVLQNIDKKKENNEMKFGNFDFGPVDSNVRMSMYGLAIKNSAGTYVAYDEKSKQIMDVDILNIDGANKFMYKVPVALREVRSGDVVVHARKPMFVQAIMVDGRLRVLDIYDGEEKTIVPARSPFGFDFITKVVSLIDFSSANCTNPFGNMLPLMLLSDSKSGDTDDLLPLMLMTSGNMDMSNPMMMYFLAGNRTNDPLALAMLMGAFNKPTHSCACGDNCSHKTDK